MHRAGLIIFAALGLSAIAAPTVFATAPVNASDGDLIRAAAPTVGARVADDMAVAVDRWCAARDDRGCAAWRAEADRPHAVQQTEERGDTRLAWVALRATSMRLRIEARQTPSGWGIDAVHGERTVRCGTAAFARVAATVRQAGPAWAARVDACAPDALRPIEIERAALRPVLIHGEEATARVHGAEPLALRWQAGAWQAR